jgi:ribosome-associated protein
MNNSEAKYAAILDQARSIVDIITDMKGEDVVLLDLREITLIADFFVICTGHSDRQLKAIAEHINEKIRDQYGKKVWRQEGDPAGGWVLMDYADIVVHIFTDEQREYYDLEGLWRDGKVLLRVQ